MCKEKFDEKKCVNLEKSNSCNSMNIIKNNIETNKVNEINQNDEMLRYIFGNEDNLKNSNISNNSNNSNEKLNDYFKDDIVSIDVKQLEKEYNETNNVNCKLKSDDNNLPISTSCDTNINNLKKNVVILKEYDNEKPINGGKNLDDGINPFDNLDMDFQTLE